MLERIKLENFKCFKSQEIPLGSISILTGLNGMGKSTVLQSLLLLRQSAEGETIKSLKLNGRYIKLGNGQDVLYEKAASDEITLAFWENGISHSYSFAYNAESAVLPLKYPLDPALAPQDSVLFGNRFLYLSSARIEPQPDYHTIDDPMQLENHEFGVNGEFSLQYLAEHSGDPILCTKAIRSSQPGARSNSLIDQLQLWCSEISPGVSPRVVVDSLRRSVDLTYDYREGNDRSGTYKSVNVGFGITYVLPVLISLLSSRPGDLILIENPEAHIHPRGQRMLGELLARVAASGIQVIVETHSDHILNGLRVAVKQKHIESSNVSIAYFSQSQNNDYAHTVVFPKMFPSGQISEWPAGFFDEWENALLDLL